MKKFLLVAIVLVLTMSLTSCCRFHQRGPCGPGHHGPCAVEKPCGMKAGAPCQKPCMSGDGATGQMPCSKQ